MLCKNEANLKALPKKSKKKKWNYNCTISASYIWIGAHHLVSLIQAVYTYATVKTRVHNKEFSVKSRCRQGRMESPMSINIYFDSLLIMEDNGELFLQNGWPTKRVKPYFQMGPLWEIFTVANLWHAASRIWTCPEPRFRLCWMKLCSSDNHYTMAPKPLAIHRGANIWCQYTTSVEFFFMNWRVNLGMI